jgi:hypothetical protein
VSLQSFELSIIFMHGSCITLAWFMHGSCTLVEVEEEVEEE